MYVLVRVRKLVTWLGEEVDEGICLTAFEELRELRAAVQTEVVNSQPPLSTDGGVQQSTLGNQSKKKHNYLCCSCQQVNSKSITTKQFSEDSNALELSYQEKNIRHQTTVLQTYHVTSFDAVSIPKCLFCII